jgi:hypothetical protein
MRRKTILFALSTASCAALEAEESAPSPPVPQQAVALTDAPNPVVNLTAPAKAEEAFVNDPRWHETVLAIAKAYPTWGRVDDEARWAPGLCRMPQPAQARISESEDSSTHGRKLYTVYAMDAQAYGFPPTATYGFQPVEGVEQVLVKEAFAPRELAAGEAWTMQLRPAVHEDKTYVPGDRRGLYLMFQLPTPAPDSDEGWVYATVDADLETVTAAGRIETCMGCHQTEEDRLFGLPNSVQAVPAAPKNATR